MAITNPTGNPASYPATVERASNGEPTTDFWANTFDPLLNRTAYLQDQLLGATNGIVGKLASQVLTSSGVRLVGAEAHTGANGQGNTLAQTLFELLGTIWDTKAGLGVANAWTALQNLNLGFNVPTGQTGTFASGSMVAGLGQKRMLRARTLLSDAAHTVDVSQGDRFELAAAPAAPRIITLDNTVKVPLQGETLAFLIPNMTSTAQPAYTFKRDGGVTIATINGSAAIGDAGAVYVEFEYTENTWRLGANSGSAYDEVTFTTKFGIIPGTGA